MQFKPEILAVLQSLGLTEIEIAELGNRVVEMRDSYGAANDALLAQRDNLDRQQAEAQVKADYAQGLINKIMAAGE